MGSFISPGIGAKHGESKQCLKPPPSCVGRFAHFPLPSQMTAHALPIKDSNTMAARDSRKMWRRHTKIWGDFVGDFLNCKRILSENANFVKITKTKINEDVCEGATTIKKNNLSILKATRSSARACEWLLGWETIFFGFFGGWVFRLRENFEPSCRNWMLRVGWIFRQTRLYCRKM